MRTWLASAPLAVVGFKAFRMASRRGESMFNPRGFKISVQVLALFVAACGPSSVAESPVLDLPDGAQQDTDEDANSKLLGGLGVGESCFKDEEGFSDCRPFLKCIDGACKATGDTQENYFCILTAECAGGLYCGLTGKCLPAGEGLQYQTCVTSADCEQGLYCEALGLAGYCQSSGEGDIGASCTKRGDCLAGLKCGPFGECAPGKLGLDVELWAGRECEAAKGQPRVYFEIPPSPSTEFFRLPFPNDLRVVDGKIDMSFFPTPGVGLMDVDLPKRLVEAIEEGQEGFSNVPAIFFRFSAAVDLSTIETTGDEPNVQLVDVDPLSEGYGDRHGYSWYASAGKGSRYMCSHWLTMQSSWKHPLKPSNRYAVVLTRGIRAAKGAGGQQGPLLTADSDLEALISDVIPEDPYLKGIWARYEVLRNYLVDQEIPLDDVIGATVFTTQDPSKTHRAIRDAISAWEPKPLGAMTLCDGAQVSPCDDGLQGEGHVRGCFEPNDDVWEIHMKVPLPIIQSGQRPYLKPEMGGAVAFDDAGAVIITAEEDVCVSLAIPKNVEPSPYGYPLLLSGHGTMGSYRSNIASLSAAFSDIEVGEARVGAAMLSWDGPMHGPRRGSPIGPELLYFNMANPKAARGNSYQGFADILALVKVVKSLSLSAADSPTGKDLGFDPTRIAYLGHSQGAGYGIPAVAHSPDLGFGIWSGAGAGLVLSLLNKTSPADTRTGIGYALGEISETGEATLSSHHPVLTLLQGYFDPIDTLHSAGTHIVQPDPQASPKHVFLSYGLDDTYTPPQAIEALARIFGVDQLEGADHSFGLNVVAPPASGNFNDGSTTGVVALAGLDDADGHFVLFTDPAQLTRVKTALGTWIVDGIPTVP